MDSKKKFFSLKAVIQTGLFIALALVIRNFSFMIYFGGSAGMRVSLAGVFTKLAAILFGPFFGGAASGLTDVLGYLLKPEGAYIPLLTATAVLGGVITGLLWKITRGTDTNLLRRIYFAIIAFSGVVGIVNLISIIFFPSGYWTDILSKLGKYRDLASIGLIATACIGVVFIIADIIIRKKSKDSSIRNDVFRTAIITGLSGIIVTTLNTFILRIFIPSLGKMGFLVFWIPRLVEEILVTLVQAYIISLLLHIYRKYKLSN
jgi:ECF transporter S component (folate family)